MKITNNEGIEITGAELFAEEERERQKKSAAGLAVLDAMVTEKSRPMRERLFKIWERLPS